MHLSVGGISKTDIIYLFCIQFLSLVFDIYFAGVKELIHIYIPKYTSNASSGDW